MDGSFRELRPTANRKEIFQFLGNLHSMESMDEDRKAAVENRLMVGALLTADRRQRRQTA